MSVTYEQAFWCFYDIQLLYRGDWTQVKLSLQLRAFCDGILPILRHILNSQKICYWELAKNGFKELLNAECVLARHIEVAVERSDVDEEMKKYLFVS